MNPNVLNKYICDTFASHEYYLINHHEDINIVNVKY